MAWHNVKGTHGLAPRRSIIRTVLQSFFFPRVRTPCGHGAQVIVEGREERQMVEKGTKTPKDQPKTKHPSPQADSTIL